jgi:hypothetical protein
VVITGENSLDSFAFDYQPADWPFNSDKLKMNYYGAEAGTWSNGWLANVPSNFTSDFHTLKC